MDSKIIVVKPWCIITDGLCCPTMEPEFREAIILIDPGSNDFRNSLKEQRSCCRLGSGARRAQRVPLETPKVVAVVRSTYTGVGGDKRM